MFYWTSESPIAEVDFVLQKEGRVIPIEVKSGENVHARSLKHYQSMYAPEKVIRFSERNFGVDGNLYSIPLYAAFCI